MDRFEQELRNAMKREPAPDWFADGVMAKLRQQQNHARPSLFRRALPANWLRWAAACAMLVVVIGGIGIERVRHEQLARQERIEGERAKDQLLLALHVTGAKLRSTQERVLSLQRPGAGQ